MIPAAESIHNGVTSSVGVSSRGTIMRRNTNSRKTALETADRSQYSFLRLWPISSCPSSRFISFTPQHILPLRCLRQRQLDPAQCLPRPCTHSPQNPLKSPSKLTQSAHTQARRAKTKDLAARSNAFSDSVRNFQRTSLTEREICYDQHEFFAQFLAQSLKESRNSERTFPRFRAIQRDWIAFCMNFPANISRIPATRLKPGN
jgi:hypothetical protein